MRMPEVGFWKLCGSGTGEGFTPRPNTAVWAILATWPDEETARRNCAEAPVYRRWRAKAAEDWTVFLSPTSARGAWSGVTPFDAGARSDTGPDRRADARDGEARGTCEILGPGARYLRT